MTEIEALVSEVGPREIEVCSFVPPKLIPQMINAAEIVAEGKADGALYGYVPGAGITTCFVPATGR